jgi:phosphoribosylglycinamide formyltransferase-1
MKKIVILISGNGSNLRAILEQHRAKAWPAEIVGVISNRPDAYGIQIAKDFKIPVEVIDHTQFSNRSGFDQELFKLVSSYQPDLVILAGFMRMLGDQFVESFAGRLMNIHPSLLPSFPGLRTHTAAIKAGVKWHGATVHFVTKEMDVGPIITQGIVPVDPTDTEESLSKKVFQIEHVIYPQAIEWFIFDQLSIEDGKVRLDSVHSAHFMLSNDTPYEQKIITK